jgi:hypothetical protein
MSGPFNTEPDVFGTLPSRVSLRLRYSTPVTAMLGVKSFIGGVQGVVFILSDNGGVVTLRDDEVPAVDNAPKYPLGEGTPNARFLQPKDKV